MNGVVQLLATRPSGVQAAAARYRVIEAAAVETNGPPESGSLVIARSPQLG